jgi:hypothetical protein
MRILREYGYAARHLSEGLPEWAAIGNGTQAASAETAAVNR